MDNQNESNITKLIKGVAVIIDDQVYNKDTPIYKIKEFLNENNIPSIAYDRIPESRYDLKVFSQVSFIILDWDFKSASALSEDRTAMIQLGAELQQIENQEVIEFIKRLMNEVFAPIFIFTSHAVDKIKEELRVNEISQKRIFIEQKDNLIENDILLTRIQEWIENNPSIYALKEWEYVTNDAKNRMFLEWENVSPNWVSSIWKRIKLDVEEHNLEFGSFLTRNIINRACSYNFSGDILSKESLNEEPNLKNIYLDGILEGERYIRYNELFKPEQAYTGDLFKIKEICEDREKEKYYLNIRAQCDISRKEKPKNSTEENYVCYNPKLYVIEGEEVKKEEITDKHKKSVSKAYLFKGSFIEKTNEAIIACVDGCPAIRFNLGKLEVKEFSELHNARIGRVMSPYITKIQQKFAQFMIREGVMPIPDEWIKD